MFLVIDGKVDMHVRTAPDTPVEVVHLTPGKLDLIDDGEEHIAHPIGEARIFVVEQEDSQ